MALSSMELRVNAICSDVGLSRSEKIMRLTHLRNQARALRRVTIGRAAVDDGWYEEVHVIEIELDGLRRNGDEKKPTVS